MSLPIVVADLDGTIIHSARRCADPTNLVVVERYDGRDVGFMTPEAWETLAHLQLGGGFMPATARTLRQYARIVMPRRPPVAVIEAGARILVDDLPHAEWDERSASLVRATGVTMADVAAELSRLELTEAPRFGDVALVYARVAPGGDRGTFPEWCAEHGWRAVDQDGRVYALPDGIDKASAVVRAAEIADGTIHVVVGDGLMDESMMALVPLALTPAGGPLWASGWRLGTSVAGYDPSSAAEILLQSSEHVRIFRSSITTTSPMTSSITSQGALT